MQYCLDTDIPVMRRNFTSQQFRHALDNRSQGIMDERSVAYWDLVLPQSKKCRVRPTYHLPRKI